MLKLKKNIVCLATVLTVSFAACAAETPKPPAPVVAGKTVAALHLLCAAAENVVKAKSGAVAGLEFENIVDQLVLSAGGLEKSQRLREAALDVESRIGAYGRENVAYTTKKRAYEQERVTQILKALAEQKTADGKEWLSVAAELAGSLPFYVDTAMGLAAGASADLSDSDVNGLRAAEDKLFDEVRRYWAEESLNDAFRLTRGSLAWIRQALNEQDAAKRAAMLELLEADSAAFPPLLFYCGEAALRAGDKAAAKTYFVRFRETWHSPLKHDPYLAQTAKYEYLLADSPTAEQMKELAERTLAHSAPGDWCERLFAAALLYSAGAKVEAIKTAQANELYKTETELSNIIAEAMRKDTTVSQELLRIASEKKVAEEARKAEEERKKALAQKLVVGSIVKFGRYYQANSYQKDPIEWRVLTEKNGRYLLISKYILDCREFDVQSNYWRGSLLRGWLNGSGFLNTAFTVDERTKIGVVTTEEYAQDKVFLLSKYEAEVYFKNAPDRESLPTAYAASKQRYPRWWFLRSPSRSNEVYEVNPSGVIYSNGNIKTAEGVRPAIWVTPPLPSAQ